jgi:hypothetical protein
VAQLLHMKEPQSDIKREVVPAMRAHVRMTDLTELRPKSKPKPQEIEVDTTASRRAKKNTIQIQESVPHSATTILQLDLLTGEVVAEHESQSKAAAAIRGSQQVISNVCRGKGPSAYGFGWRFAILRPVSNTQ